MAAKTDENLATVTMQKIFFHRPCLISLSAKMTFGWRKIRRWKVSVANENKHKTVIRAENERQWTHGIKSYRNDRRRALGDFFLVTICHSELNRKRKLSAGASRRNSTTDDLKTNLVGSVSSYITKSPRIRSSYQGKRFWRLSRLRNNINLHAERD